VYKRTIFNKHKLLCQVISLDTGRVSRVLHPAQHITGHFRDESFQAITCTGTNNSKQTGENTPKTQKNTKINKLALGK